MIIFDLIFVIAFLFTSVILFMVILVAIIQVGKFGEIVAFLVLLISTLVVSVSTLLNDANNVISMNINNESLEFRLFSGERVHILKNDLTLIRKSQRQLILIGASRKVVIQKRFLTSIDKQFVYKFFDKTNFPKAEFQYPVF